MLDDAKLEGVLETRSGGVRGWRHGAPFYCHCRRTIGAQRRTMVELITEVESIVDKVGP